MPGIGFGTGVLKWAVKALNQGLQSTYNKDPNMVYVMWGCSINRGPQNRPMYTMILITGTTKHGAPSFRKQPYGIEYRVYGVGYLLGEGSRGSYFAKHI